MVRRGPGQSGGVVEGDTTASTFEVTLPRRQTSGDLVALLSEVAVQAYRRGITSPGHFEMTGEMPMDPLPGL